MAAGDLTDLASVRQHLQVGDAADTDQDALIGEMISSVSRHIMRYCQREFAPPVSVSTERLFRYDGRGILNLAPYDARTVTAVEIDADGDDPSELDSDAWRLMPLPAVDGVYTHLHLPALTAGRATSPAPAYRVVGVTGTWGFAAVPDDVKRAANIAVGYLIRTTSALMGDEMDVPASLGGRTALPGASRALLASYRRHSVGV